jgi:hypothetical protein
MRRREFLGSGLVLSLGTALPTAMVTGARAADDAAQGLLAASDAIRNPGGSFSIHVKLTEFRKGRQVNASSLVVYSKPAPNSGQYNNLVRFVAPARDSGKLMLRNGLDLWFYDPATRASVRISPQQRLLGQASNSDVMSTNLARDYHAAITATETVKDGDGKERETTRLRLKALRSDAPYLIVDYWIDPANQRPVLARYYTAEERLLKLAYFRRFQPVLGALRPTETVIIDGLDPDWVTLMQTSDYAQRDIPDEWLQRDFLARFAGD